MMIWTCHQMGLSFSPQMKRKWGNSLRHVTKVLLHPASVARKGAFPQSPMLLTTGPMNRAIGQWYSMGENAAYIQHITVAHACLYIPAGKFPFTSESWQPLQGISYSFRTALPSMLRLAFRTLCCTWSFAFKDPFEMWDRRLLRSN